jgi:kynurenine formamidase
MAHDEKIDQSDRTRYQPASTLDNRRSSKSHQILFERNVPAFENVANLDKLPLKGFSVIALP